MSEGINKDSKGRKKAKVQPAQNGKDLKATVDKICTSGQPTLDSKLIKIIKKTCKVVDHV